MSSEQTVIVGDCLDQMRAMAAGSISAVVTSPPYNLGKKYRLHRDNMPITEYLAWQGEVAKELCRLLRPDGHVFLNVGSNSGHPWQSTEVGLAYGRHFVKQNHIIWVKSLALHAKRLRDDPTLKALPEVKANPKLFAALCEVMHDRTFGQLNSFVSDAYLLSCYEDIFHFSPSGRSLIDPRVEGVPLRIRGSAGAVRS